MWYKKYSSEIIKNPDKYFDNLELIIQNIKSNKDSFKSSLISQEELHLLKTNNNNFNFAEKEKYDADKDALSQVEYDFDSTKNEYIEMETSLISELTDIKTSINKILEDRNALQSQHRIWLQNMKKKIFQTKEKTRKIEIHNQT